VEKHKSPTALFFLKSRSNFLQLHVVFHFAGNPLTENHIRWERVDYEMSEKTKMTYENGTSYLHILDAQRDDIGHFRCIADNRVANPISRDVLLIVKCELGRDLRGGNC
jgi:hypothetical protein